MYDSSYDEVLYKLNKKLNNAYYDMMILQEECANLENINYETQTIEEIDNICDVRTTTFERLDLIIDKIERLQKEIMEICEIINMCDCCLKGQTYKNNLGLCQCICYKCGDDYKACLNRCDC